MKHLLAAAGLIAGLTHPSVAQDRVAELVALGQPIYEANCASCHSKTGKGFIGPSFIGNDRIANDALVLRQINRGSSDMPAFGKTLTPEEIVAVGTYIRNSWGNSYGVLQTE